MPAINTVAEFNTALESPYAWPGGYPMYFITSDGAALSFEAARENAEQIRESIASNARDGWKVEAVEVNWEDAELICDHTGKPIESAYGD
jgi:hypothetical protein